MTFHPHDTVNEDEFADNMREALAKARDAGCCPDCVAKLLLTYALGLAKHVLAEPDPYVWLRKQGELHRAMPSTYHPSDGRLH
jgi:hypothetical protein